MSARARLPSPSSSRSTSRPSLRGLGRNGPTGRRARGSRGCTYADQVCFRAITCQLPLPTFGFPGACSHFRVRLARLERRAEGALRAGSELAPSTPRRNWTSAVVRAEKAMRRVLSAERGEVVSKPRCVADYALGIHIHFLAQLRRLQNHHGPSPLTGGSVQCVA